MRPSNSDRFVELKYCERCGGLWLRAKGSAEIYCMPCDREMAEFPAARPSRRRRPQTVQPEVLHAAAFPCRETNGESWSGSVA
ncbi:MAG: hypothetical protein AB7O65_08040 [Candidatus Korobacteraceae bacterium]